MTVEWSFAPIYWHCATWTETVNFAFFYHVKPNMFSKSYLNAIIDLRYMYAIANVHIYAYRQICHRAYTYTHGCAHTYVCMNALIPIAAYKNMHTYVFIGYEFRSWEYSSVNPYYQGLIKKQPQVNENIFIRTCGYIEILTDDYIYIYTFCC